MFGLRNRKDRKALIESMPVDDEGNVLEGYLREHNDARSERSRRADSRSTAKRVYPIRMSPKQAASWVANPGRSDVEGIDTKAPANVGRRGTKATRPKAPAPVPVRDPGVVVQGDQVIAIATIYMAAECLPICLGNGECSMDWKGNYGIALTRRDGRGMFGLDNASVSGLCAYNSEDMNELDGDVLYKVSVEKEKLVFRTGEDFSDIELKAATIRIDTPFTPESIGGSANPQMSDLDAFGFRELLDRMKDAGAVTCELESSKNGISIKSSGGRSVIRGVIGPPMGGKAVRSCYRVDDLHTLMRGLTPYVYSIGFSPDDPMVLKGRMDEYEIVAVVRSCGDLGENASKPVTGRRNKR